MSSGASAALSSCGESSCWQHGTARITCASQRTARSSAASVAVSQACSETTRSARSPAVAGDVADLEAKPLGTEPPGERLAVATTSSLRSRPTRSTSRPCTAVSRWCSANVRYDLPEPKSTTRSSPRRQRRQHVVDELEEAVDLAELRIALRLDAAVRSSRRARRETAPVFRPQQPPLARGRGPAPAGRLAGRAQHRRGRASGQHLVIGIGRVEERLTELAADQVERAGARSRPGARFSSRRPRRWRDCASDSGARCRRAPGRS